MFARYPGKWRVFTEGVLAMQRIVPRFVRTLMPLVVLGTCLAAPGFDEPVEVLSRDASSLFRVPKSGGPRIVLV